MKKIECFRRFNAETKWGQHVLDVAARHPHLTTTKAISKIATDEWNKKYKRKPRRRYIRPVAPTPPPSPTSEYKRFWINTALENPHLKTTRERDALVRKLWIEKKRKQNFLLR